MMNTKAVMRSLPLVACILGKKYGINIEIGGTEAYTDGKNIHLPALPLEAHDDFLMLARGYTDHEAAHIRETDFDAVKRANMSALEQHVWNVIEDWRVENALAQVFPGCRGNFKSLIRHMFGGKAESSVVPGVLILNWLLLVVRSWDVPELAESRDSLAAQMDSEFPDLRERLEAILSRVRISCTSTIQAIGFAKEIVLELRCVAAEQAPDTKSSPDTPQSQGQQSGDPETDNALTSSDADEAPSSPITTTGARAIEALLDATSQDLPRSMGEALAAQLRTDCMNAGSNRLTVAIPIQKNLQPLSPGETQEALRTSVALRTKLHALLQAKVQVRNVTGRRGKLDTKSIHKLSLSDPRVFCRNSYRQGMNTAVHILLDCSGSMVRRIKLTCMASYAVAKTLSLMQVNVAITAFPGGSLPDGSYGSVTPVVRHGQQVHNRLDLDPNGSTPMAEALWWTMQNMLGLREHRKIILILTDGEPDSSEAALHAIYAAKDIGFEVHGIGIGSTGMEYLLPEHSRTIHSLTDLPQAMFEILTKTLITQA